MPKPRVVTEITLKRNAKGESLFVKCHEGSYYRMHSLIEYSIFVVPDHIREALSELASVMADLMRLMPIWGENGCATQLKFEHLGSDNGRPIFKSSIKVVAIFEDAEGNTKSHEVEARGLSGDTVGQKGMGILIELQKNINILIDEERRNQAEQPELKLVS